MKNLLLSLVLLSAFLMVSCEKDNQHIKTRSCAACEDNSFQDSKAALPAGITQEIKVDLVITPSGYYSKGQINYYQDGKDVAVIIYKEKEGEFIGIKKTFMDSDNIPAYSDIDEGSCVPNVPLRMTKCCEFKQTPVL
ncbi:MAG: hypothetical protein AB8E82_02220 [Aureispira sp.]